MTGKRLSEMTVEELTVEREHWTRIATNARQSAATRMAADRHAQRCTDLIRAKKPNMDKAVSHYAGDRQNETPDFEDYLTEIGAKALARLHKFDPDEVEMLLTDGDMRKKRTPGNPHWHRYRDDARAVVRAMFDRDRFQDVPVTISTQSMRKAI
jgi:hypothetical protein